LRYEFKSSRGSLVKPAEQHQRYRPPGELESVEQATIELMPEPVAREQLCLPLAKVGEVLHVATNNAGDVLMQDKLRFLLNCDVRLHFFPVAEILAAINFHYGSDSHESSDSLLQEFTDTAIDFTETEQDADVAYAYLASPKNAANSHYAPRRARYKRNRMQAAANSQTKDEIIGGNHGMFFYTIREGQKTLVYRLNGQIDLVEGPARVWRGFSRFSPMKHTVAHPGEFLIVSFHDGTQQHLEGPAETWLDPRVHSKIECKEGLAMGAKEAVVVYGPGEDGNTKRRIVNGPGLFVPEPGEWLHEFSWHSSIGGSKGVEKVPNGLKFQKLWLMPDQMYHDVRDVRTADDAVLIVRLMIFFELLDIEKMLDATHDPIGDFINAATSDVVEFTGKRTFDQFKQQTEQLNELSTYSQLLHRAAQSGYRINNVVYRGYGAPDSLQKMHDEAIQARTKLQLEKATETQSQELEDYRLECQVDRSRRRRDEQTAEVEHDLELREKRDQAELESEQRLADFRRDVKLHDAESEAAILDKNNELQRVHLQQLKKMGVDLTDYLTQGRADQVIELRGRQSSAPHLHLTQRNGEKKKQGAKK